MRGNFLNEVLLRKSGRKKWYHKFRFNDRWKNEMRLSQRCNLDCEPKKSPACGLRRSVATGAFASGHPALPVATLFTQPLFSQS